MKVIITGVVKQIGNIEEYGDKGFKKAEIIVQTVEENPQFYPIEFTGANTELINNLQEGKNYRITSNLSGREYTNPETGKYSVFIGLRGWKIESF